MKKKKFEDFPLNWFVVFPGYDRLIEGSNKLPRCAFRYQPDAELYVISNFNEIGFYEQNTIEE